MEFLLYTGGDAPTCLQFSKNQIRDRACRAPWPHLEQDFGQEIAALVKSGCQVHTNVAVVPGLVDETGPRLGLRRVGHPERNQERGRRRRSRSPANHHLQDGTQRRQRWAHQMRAAGTGSGMERERKKTSLSAWVGLRWAWPRPQVRRSLNCGCRSGL